MTCLSPRKRGVGANRFDGDAGGEDVVVAIEDVAAAGCLPEFALGIVLLEARQFVVAQHLQIHEPIAQAGECC